MDPDEWVKMDDWMKAHLSFICSESCSAYTTNQYLSWKHRNLWPVVWFSRRVLWVFYKQIFSSFTQRIFYCVLVHECLPCAALHHTVYCVYCFLALFDFTQVLFFSFFHLPLYVCSSFFIPPSHYRMMDVALLIMSSPLSLVRWVTVSQHHLLCSLLLSFVFSFLSVSVLFPLYALPSPSPHTPSVMDAASSVSAITGALGPVMPEDPEDSGQAKLFPTRCSLNSSWETNEDEFGGWMCFCTKGMPGFPSKCLFICHPQSSEAVPFCFYLWI